jgi:hypothetical protein
VARSRVIAALDAAIRAVDAVNAGADRASVRLHGRIDPGPDGDSRSRRRLKRPAADRPRDPIL